MCRSLHHPNIVMMLGSIVEEACIIFIMNLVDGSDLQSLIFNESKRKVRYLHTCSLHFQSFIIIIVTKIGESLYFHSNLSSPSIPAHLCTPIGLP